MTKTRALSEEQKSEATPIAVVLCGHEKTERNSSSHKQLTCWDRKLGAARWTEGRRGKDKHTLAWLMCTTSQYFLLIPRSQPQTHLLLRSLSSSPELPRHSLCESYFFFSCFQFSRNCVLFAPAKGTLLTGDDVNLLRVAMRWVAYILGKTPATTVRIGCGAFGSQVRHTSFLI